MISPSNVDPRGFTAELEFVQFALRTDPVVLLPTAPNTPPAAYNCGNTVAAFGLVLKGVHFLSGPHHWVRPATSLIITVPDVPSRKCSTDHAVLVGIPTFPPTVRGLSVWMTVPVPVRAVEMFV